MATRNLTESFEGIRNECKREKSLNRSPSVPESRLSHSDRTLLSAAGPGQQNPLTAISIPAVQNMLPPTWVDLVEEVERYLLDIEGKVAGLKDLHRKRLMVSFDADEAAQDAAIEAQARGMTAAFRKAERVLKQISDDTDFTGAAATPSSASDAKLRVNVVRTLASRLQQKSVAFRKAQRDFLQRRHEQKRAAAGGTGGGGGGVGGGGFDFLDEEKGKAPALVNVDLSGGGMTMEQLAVVDDLESTVAQRDHEINSIMESIEELSSIFKELAVLVIDQGTVLDRIDFNMEQVVEKVAEGVVELDRAEKYQKSARPRWCIAILLVLIAVFTTLLVLKHDNGGGGGGGGKKKGNRRRLLRGTEGRAPSRRGI